VSGISYEKVVEVASRHGWRDGIGATLIEGWCAAKTLGIGLKPLNNSPWMGLSLNRFLASCDHNSKYILDVKGHWLSVVCGEIIELPRTHRRTVVRMAYQVVEHSISNEEVNLDVKF
jgi:hypothetical protein